MAETVLGHRHADSIITAIYEGTSEVQVSFALKEMSKGALFTTLEDVRTELLPLRECHEQPVQLVLTGIEWINSCLGALMGNPQDGPCRPGTTTGRITSTRSTPSRGC
jgi:hypothetical protein